MLNKATLCDVSLNQSLLLTTTVSQLCALPFLSNSQIVCLANLRVDANVISWLQEDILQLLHQPPAVVHTGAENTGTKLALLAH